MDIFEWNWSITWYILEAMLFLGSLLAFVIHWIPKRTFVDSIEAILIVLLCLMVILKKIGCAILEWGVIAEKLSSIHFFYMFGGLTDFFDFMVYALIDVILLYCTFSKKRTV